MMKVIPFFTFTIVSLGIVCGSRLPSFAWDGTRSSVHGVPHLTVQFNDGSIDAAVLRRVNPIPLQPNEQEEDLDDCIFEGHLENHPDYPVSVTGGCPFSSEFEVTMFSEKLPGDGFIVKRDSVEIVDPNRHQHGYLTVEDQTDSRSHTNISCTTTLPKKGFRYLMKAFIDASWRLKFGNQSWNVARRVLAHAQTIYRHYTLKTTYELVTVQAMEIPESIYASGAFLELVKKYPDNPDLNGYVFLAHQSPQDSYSGFAWVEQTCSELQVRTSISEWSGSEVETGFTIAHEISHNLGMHHHYDEDCGRSDPDRFRKIKWIRCHIDDMCRYYSQFNVFCVRENWRA